MRKVLNKIKLEIKTQKNSNTRKFCMLYNPETQSICCIFIGGHICTVKYSDSSDWLSLTNPNHCCIFIF